MPLLELDSARFTSDFNERPFRVRHELVDHPAFTLERLVELARRMPPEAVEYNAGDLPLTQDPKLTPRTGLSIEETIRRITDARSWMVLKRVEIDDEYRRILDQCLDEIAPQVPGMRSRQAFVFISSPGSVTPYHIDHEYNFLLQIRGTKLMSIFDRGVLTEEEIERFYRGEHRNLTFDERRSSDAQTFELSPGDGVHVPVNAPHYVKNGPAASVSFSITFRTPEGDRRSSVYRVNERMRSIGIKPRAVGDTPLIDRAKYLSYALYKKVQRRLAP
ncbi:MAG: transcription factor [Myxococcota bacterium]|nr:cupin-like domain-containing protein [Deltaproteobacteria bacterium]MDQ3336632.1 transcription factor [Myxococcota bacterium]